MSVTFCNTPFEITSSLYLLQRISAAPETPQPRRYSLLLSTTYRVYTGAGLPCY